MVYYIKKNNTKSLILTTELLKAVYQGNQVMVSSSCCLISISLNIIFLSRLPTLFPNF